LETSDFFSGMTGAIINAAGIVVGGVWGLSAKKPIQSSSQMALKIVIGVFGIWLGVKLAWSGINGSLAQTAKELGIVVLGMTLGKLAGKLCRFQKLSNSVGQYAGAVLAAPPSKEPFSASFTVATALFCVGPLALLASLHEGLTGFSPVFLVKAATDGLATYAFCTTLGWGAIASAIPVLALEGALIRGGQLLEPFLRHQPKPLIDAINTVDGLLIFCVAMIILELKKIEVADYYPSLVFTPLLIWWLW
jgi:hypothetical protein